MKNLSWFLLVVTICLFCACEKEEKTVIYGSVCTTSNEPIANAKIIVGYDVIDSCYTGDDGCYELSLYNSTNDFIPVCVEYATKYKTYYDTKTIKITSGEKYKCDFTIEIQF